MSRSIGSAIIIGAGIAGLACGLELARAGLAVTLLDKGRRPGGRVATRRIGARQFNHGAQFVTARGAEFSALLGRLQAEGVAAAWPAAGADRGRMAFMPAMSALPTALAQQAISAGATLALARQASCLHADGGRWRVRHWAASEIRPEALAAAGGELSDGHDLVLMPPPQHALSLALRGRGVRLGGACRGDDSFPCTDEGTPSRLRMFFAALTSRS